MVRRGPTTTWLLGIAAGSVLLASCGGGDGTTHRGAPGSHPPVVNGRVGSAGASSTGPTSAPAAPRRSTATPVPAPRGGTVDQIVPGRTRTTDKPVPLGGVASFGSVTARISRHSVISFQARLPGEISGEAAALTLEIVNRSAAPLSAAAVVVNVSGADGTPLVAVTSPPARPLAGTLRPGDVASGVYVFQLGSGVRYPATVQVSVDPASPVLVFRGSLR